MKKVLLLDMDGPLADFERAFWKLCKENGWLFDIDRLEDSRHRFMSDHIPDPEHLEAARAALEVAGWFESLPVTAGAKAGVAALLEVPDLDVWVCSKPMEANPTCRDAKGAWLREHFPELEHKLILAPEKHLVAGDYLLDDAPALDQIDQAGWSPIVFTAPYNGTGSEWDRFPHWTWSDGIRPLLSLVGAYPRRPACEAARSAEEQRARDLHPAGKSDWPAFAKDYLDPDPAALADRHEAFMETYRANLQSSAPMLAQDPPPEDATNPKDLVGVTKPQLHLVPESFLIQVAQAMTDGAAKYGPFNWREKAVRASVYQSAAKRHLGQWFDGEEDAEDSGVHHLAHAAACIAILLDALAIGKLADDRPTPGAASRLISEFTKGKLPT